jgi:hypothetical protein
MMNDTFSFIAPVMPRRTVDPFALRLALAAGAFVLLVGAFGAFVVQHERSADVARAALEERALEQAAARAEAVPDVRIDPDVAALLDSQARSSAERALELATTAFAGTRDFADAGPSQLGVAQPSMLFVDGPSTSPAVVSIEATSSTWSAAVMAPSGLCYWIATTADGAVWYDTGRACTGDAAAAADERAW